MTTRQKTCAERIQGELDDRIESMTSAKENFGEDLAESILAVSSKRVFTIELSWGGPQDYFEVEVDDEGGIEEITYHFLDWFDGAETKLTGEEFTIVENWINQHVYLGGI